MTDVAPLSPEEIEICGCVSANRGNLKRFFDDFVLSVQLFELLERGGGGPHVGVFGGVFVQYRIIAAKEGALSIYHFSNSLDALRSQVMRCPLTQKSTNALRLKEAFGLFRKYFPHTENARHGVAHAGEIWASPSKAKEHLQAQDYSSPGISFGGGIYYTQGLFERTYSLGWKGKVFEVQMDANTIQKLLNVLILANSAFDPYPSEP